MPRKPSIIHTSHPLGLKINEVLAAKGMPGDYAKFAVPFGVAPQSVRDWVRYGRMAKKHYPKLVEWSGRSLEWWHGMTDDISPLRTGEPTKGARAGTQPIIWPFDYHAYGRLTALQRSLGAKRYGEAIKELDSLLDIVLTKWEREAAEKRAPAPA